MKHFSLILLGLALTVSGCGRNSSASLPPTTLDDLNRIVSTLNTLDNGGLPDTNRVASVLALQGRSFPVPPAGKRLAINPATRQFEFVNQ